MKANEMCGRTSCIVIVWLLVFTACSNTTTYEEALELNRKNVEDASRLDDANFLVAVKSLNLFQLGLLKVATESGYAAEIVNLGKDNIGPFTTLDGDLTEVAKREKFRLPTEMSAEHQRRLETVKKASRREVDQLVISEMRSSTDETVEMFREHATEANDADVRAFAARKLGALRAHSQQIRKVEEGLLTTAGEE